MTNTNLNLGNATVPTTPLEPKRYFFDVSPMKLLVMSTVTLGLIMDAAGMLPPA